MREVSEITNGNRAAVAPWIIAILLAFIAGLLWTRANGSSQTAFAQSAPLVGARGIYAFTGQLDHNRYGLFMLDIEQGTIWCYEIDSSEGVRKLRLTAARSWLYDRYLRDFNCVAPDFRAVQKLVEQQRGAGQPDISDNVGEIDRDRRTTETEKPPGKP